jgi:hypothetical protein
MPTENTSARTNANTEIIIVALAQELLLTFSC